MRFSNADPWDFYNGDPVLGSPTRLHFIEYGQLSEIAMGGPLIGSCYLFDENNRYLVSEYCGGPPCWEKSGARVALPIWRKHWFKGWVQRLAVADIETKKLVLFKPLFSELHIRCFDEPLVEGTDSPLHKPGPMRLGISKEKVFKIISLQSCSKLSQHKSATQQQLHC